MQPLKSIDEASRDYVFSQAKKIATQKSNLNECIEKFTMAYIEVLEKYEYEFPNGAQFELVPVTRQGRQASVHEIFSLNFLEEHAKSVVKIMDTKSWRVAKGIWKALRAAGESYETKMAKMAVKIAFDD